MFPAQPATVFTPTTPVEERRDERSVSSTHAELQKLQDVVDAFVKAQVEYETAGKISFDVGDPGMIAEKSRRSAALKRATFDLMQSASGDCKIDDVPTFVAKTTIGDRHYTLDGASLNDGDQLMVTMPDGTEQRITVITERRSNERMAFWRAEVHGVATLVDLLGLRARRAEPEQS